MANQDEYVRITLRMPPELHRFMSRLAKYNHRSLNAEIVSRLLLLVSDTNGDLIAGGVLKGQTIELLTNDQAYEIIGSLIGELKRRSALLAQDPPVDVDKMAWERLEASYEIADEDRDV